MHKSNWITTTLEDICQSGGGLQTGPFGSQLHASEYSEEGIPIVMPKDLINQRISVATVARIPEERANDLKRHRLKPGDIVFGRRGDIGRCAIVTNTEDGWICGSGSLRVRLNSEVSPQYLIYYLGQPHVIHWLVSNAVGQTMLNLSAGILASLPIELPPLPEQRKIAEILSTWDEAIDLTAQLMAAKQRRKQALMQRLLTGQVRFPGFSHTELIIGRFDDFVVLQRGFDLPVSEREQGVFKVIASNGQVGFHNIGKVKGPGVVTGRSGTIGSVHYEENDFWPLNTTLYVKDFKGNHPLFVYYFLQQFHLERFGTGSGVPTLNRNDVHQVIIGFPILAEQIRIADFLQIIDQELALLQQKLAALRRQKQGLMQQLLTGKVRVQV